MPSRRLQLNNEVPAEIRDGLARLRAELEVPDAFADQVLREAEQRAAEGQMSGATRIDMTDIEFVTIDPEGSMDLDQALLIERRGDGFRVRYAIADVASWVVPSGAIDDETRRRGQTFYAPVERVPLHPAVLSESAASLLADGSARPALVWTIDLDASGVQTAATVERAIVRSRDKLSYVGVQKMLDEGTASESLQLLREVGMLRQQQEAARGGVSLNLPEQEIVTDESGWRTVFRAPLPVEDWNAQISLLTGMAAARMMLDAGVGLVRTLPPADPRAVDKLRRTARSLHIDWPREMGYPDFVRSLDVGKPSHLAMMTACTSLFRGAAYTVVDEASRGSDLKHNALAVEYAHTTAPLRRLVDRFVGEVCVSLCAGVPVPEWVLTALPELPELMRVSDQRAKKFERGVVDLVEALVMSSHIGEVFDAVVVEVDQKGGDISVPGPAIETRINAHDLELGAEIQVRVARADTVAGRVDFELV